MPVTAVAADVVTADGRVLRATADEHADLFWALRGGGNFGVVTTFDVIARPATGVHFGTITYPATDAAKVLLGWRDAVRTAPEELTTTARMFPSFGGPVPPLVIAVCYAGDDATAAGRAIEPLLSLGAVGRAGHRGDAVRGRARGSQRPATVMAAAGQEPLRAEPH